MASKRTINNVFLTGVNELYLPFELSERGKMMSSFFFFFSAGLISILYGLAFGPACVYTQTARGSAVTTSEAGPKAASHLAPHFEFCAFTHKPGRGPLLCVNGVLVNVYRSAMQTCMQMTSRIKQTPQTERERWRKHKTFLMFILGREDKLINS